MVTFKRCGHEYIAHCPNVALSGEEGATCSEHTIPGELDALRARLSAAERERDAAFARGVEAAALEVEWRLADYLKRGGRTARLTVQRALEEAGGPVESAR